MRAYVFRFASESGHHAMRSACPFDANIESEHLIRSPYRRWQSAGSRAFRTRRLVWSDRQACLKEASLMALAVDFALVVLGSEVGGHGEFRLAL
jgi:hypothetical protein